MTSAGFNQQILAQKLAKLNSTQQSIETISAWCTFYRKEAKRVVAAWEAEFARAPNMQKKLALMYLANDVLQNSRKKGPEYVNEFFGALKKPVQHMLKHGDAKVKKSVERLIAIWEDRRVFGLSGTKHFKQMVEPAEPQRKASGVGMANGNAAGDASSGSLQPLTAAVAEAQVAASRSASLSEACSRTLQGDLLQNGNLTELEAGRQVLGDLSGALEAEVAARSQVIQLLKALLQQHEEAVHSGQAQLDVCRQQLTQFDEHIKAGTYSPLAPTIDEEEAYSPSAGAEGGEDAWDTSPAEGDPAAEPQPLGAEHPPMPPPQGLETRASQEFSFHPVRKNPRLAATQPQPHQAPPLPPLAPASVPLQLPSLEQQQQPTVQMDSNAALLAAQLSGGEGVKRLLEALAALPQEQQQAISSDLASFRGQEMTAGPDMQQNQYEPGHEDDMQF